MLPTKLWFIWPNGFRGEEFKKSKSSTLKQLGQMDRNVVGSIYGNCSFRYDPLTNMAIISNSCFLLVDF
jgi:hypothetical protein